MRNRFNRNTHVFGFGEDLSPNTNLCQLVQWVIHEQVSFAKGETLNTVSNN